MKVNYVDENTMICTVTCPSRRDGYMVVLKPKIGMWKEGGLRRLVDLAVDAPQEEFGQAGGSYIAGNVWLSINHVLEGSN